jgi:uncharacterized protein (DUF1778 family)
VEIIPKKKRFPMKKSHKKTPVLQARTNTDGRSRRFPIRLNISPRQAKLLRLLAQWENKSVESYTTKVLLAMMESSLEDMQSLAMNDNALNVFGLPKAPEQIAWAKRFYPRVQKLLAKGGGL